MTGFSRHPGIISTAQPAPLAFTDNLLTGRSNPSFHSQPPNHPHDSTTSLSLPTSFLTSPLAQLPPQPSSSSLFLQQLHLPWRHMYVALPCIGWEVCGQKLSTNSFAKQPQLTFFPGSRLRYERAANPLSHLNLTSRISLKSARNYAEWLLVLLFASIQFRSPQHSQILLAFIYSVDGWRHEHHHLPTRLGPRSRPQFADHAILSFEIAPHRWRSDRVLGWWWRSSM